MKIELFGSDPEKDKSEDVSFIDQAYRPEILESIEIDSHRSIEGEPRTVILEENDFLEFTFDDGTVWFAQQDDLSKILDGSTRSKNGTLTIPPHLAFNTGKRGAITKILLKMARVLRPPATEIAKPIVRKIAQEIELQIVAEGFHTISRDFILNKGVGGVDFSKPVLLLLHGTSSSTKGSFEELKGTEAWNIICSTYKGNIIAFEHRTWSKNPLENALDLLIGLPRKVTLHLLSHSRGGLVGDILSRCGKPNSQFTKREVDFLGNLDRTDDAKLLEKLNSLVASKHVEVANFVRVACPANGTTLLSKRLDHFLNVLLNVVGYGTGQSSNPVYIGIKSLLTATVSHKNDPGVLPGLEAMIPGSPIQHIINNQHNEIQGNLSVISGNAGAQSFGKTLLFLLSKLFYRTDNDFVVDTDSMFMGCFRSNPVYYRHVSGGSVDHFSYFKNNDTQNAVATALCTQPGESPTNFKLVSRYEKNRNISINLAGGEIAPPQKVSGEKPIVVVLPGIMGSNIYSKENEIWLHYIRVMGGSLDQIQMESEDVSAKTAMKSAYGKFIKFLSEQGFEPVIFPYDWRLAIKEAGKQLADKITDLQSYGQTIHLVGHSMGGLVIRELMLKHNDCWDKLKSDTNFKCILLGTPWLGSYLITEAITGRGKTINSLAKLAFLAHSKRELLSIFVRYSGFLQLLPIDSGAFEDIKTWKSLEKATNTKKWEIPEKKDLDNFKAYKSDVSKNLASLDLDKVIYIAGRNEATVCGYDIRGTRQKKLVFLATNEGDGSVTWASGIPDNLGKDNLYFMETTHGELANDEMHFDAIKQLLTDGSTRLLSRTKPISRGEGGIFELLPEEILSNDTQDLVQNVLGQELVPFFREEKAVAHPIRISVKAGHLKYTKHPLMVGHFKGDGILSAEREADFLLDGKLSEIQALGLYPGPIGSNVAVLPANKGELGVIVVGLGEPDNLTAFQLRKTIQLGCLKYVSELKHQDRIELGKVGISTLLVGTAYASLSMTNALNSILDGVIMANETLAELDSDLPLISDIEFVELYFEKSQAAFHIIKRQLAGARYEGVELVGGIQMADGHRQHSPIDDELEWWKRITVTEVGDKLSNQTFIDYTASTGRAKVSRRENFSNRKFIDSFLKRISNSNIWDRQITKTLFEMLIPNDFKDEFRNQHNILWILDKSTAAFPWELFHYDEEGTEPICVTAGMIRQLTTRDDIKAIRPVSNLSVLVIGDPDLNGIHAPQLPGAEKEAKFVGTIFDQNGFNPIVLTKSPIDEILTQLYQTHRVIHVASHGVIEFGDGKRTGILLADGQVLTAAEINQISTTPELVFLNCCYLGAIDPSAEAYSQEKYRLAANLGTQFIENGVKAVVIAGWAVDDEAAKRFAEVFYTSLLEGAIFADAVKSARGICYKEFPNTNTWGAYQCYGDQFYQLVRKSTRLRTNERYSLPKEILIDLEIFTNDAKSSRKRSDQLLQRLKDISKAIEESGFRNAPISEREAIAYAELGEVDRAIEIYNSAFKEEEAHNSMKSIEQWCLLNAHRLVQLKQAKYKIDYESEIDSIIKKLTELKSLGASPERLSILGSTYKRKALLSDTEKQVKDNLIEASNCYYEAFTLNNSEMNESRTYQVHNWIIIELMLHPNRTTKIDKALGTKLIDFLEMRMKELESTPPDRLEFWDLVEKVHLNNCRLLLNKSSVFQKNTSAKILKDYTRAWKMGGSIRHKTSEVTQFEFIAWNLEKLNGSRNVINTMRKLAKEFDRLHL